MKTFAEIRAINVNQYVEKKGKFSYLSWAWAVDQILQLDPTATWDYKEPTNYSDGTMMVYCTVTAFNKSMTAQLPVMDNYNKPIPNPSAMQVNTAMQRCLAKSIALHGLGLYIYQGEDLPDVEPEPVDIEPMIEAIMQAPDLESMKAVYIQKYKEVGENQIARKALERAKDVRKSELEGTEQ